MAELALDSNGDLLIENNSFVIIEGDDALTQRLTVRFKFFLGEWFLDKRKGLPAFEEIYVKNPNFARIRSIFQQTIVSTPGIASMESFSLDLESSTRKLSVVFRARKVDGEIFNYDNEFIIK